MMTDKQRASLDEVRDARTRVIANGGRASVLVAKAETLIEMFDSMPRQVLGLRVVVDERVEDGVFWVGEFE